MSQPITATTEFQVDGQTMTMCAYRHAELMHSVTFGDDDHDPAANAREIRERAELFGAMPKLS